MVHQTDLVSMAVLALREFNSPLELVQPQVDMLSSTAQLLEVAVSPLQEQDALREVLTDLLDLLVDISVEVPNSEPMPTLEAMPILEAMPTWEATPVWEVMLNSQATPTSAVELVLDSAYKAELVVVQEAQGSQLDWPVVEASPLDAQELDPMAQDRVELWEAHEALPLETLDSDPVFVFHRVEPSMLDLEALEQELSVLDVEEAM